jgi:hypothetical protein
MTAGILTVATSSFLADMFTVGEPISQAPSPEEPAVNTVEDSRVLDGSPVVQSPTIYCKAEAQRPPSRHGHHEQPYPCTYPPGK